MITSRKRSAYEGLAARMKTRRQFAGPLPPPGWVKTRFGTRPPPKAMPSSAIVSARTRARPEEVKYIDIATTAYNCVTDATRAVLINGVATGSTAITREGNQAYFKSVQIRGFITHINSNIISGDANTPSRSDVYIIYDDQPGAAVPSNTEIMSLSNSNSFMNLDFRERFRVLHHSYYVLGAHVATSPNWILGGPIIVPVEVYQRFNVRTSFKGTGATIGDISKGAIYIVTFGSQSVSSNCGGELSAAIRLRFTER